MELAALTYTIFNMLVVRKVKHAGVNIYMDTLSPSDLKGICNTIMNMDPRVLLSVNWLKMPNSLKAV
jgi:hypothetical protein